MDKILTYNKIFKYLNISDSVYSTTSLIRYWKKRRFNYIMTSDSSIKIGYLIDTIDGYTEIPIFSNTDINKKKKINTQLKRIISLNNLVKYTYLPKEICIYINSLLY